MVYALLHSFQGNNQDVRSIVYSIYLTQIVAAESCGYLGSNPKGLRLETLFLTYGESMMSRDSQNEGAQRRVRRSVDSHFKGEG